MAAKDGAKWPVLGGGALALLERLEDILRLLGDVGRSLIRERP
jgi:hypothetical protein